MLVSKNHKTKIAVTLGLLFSSTCLAEDFVSEKEIEVIEVSAQKRVSALQETPIAISAFNKGALDDKNIEDALDIQFAVPNMIISANSGYNIRGVGNNAVSSSSDPGTGVHINGVYMTNNTIENEFYDLQSIEVLRGPQGTLYGRNTTAGVVNAITRRPTDSFEVYAHAEIASFSTLRTTGAVNFSIADNIQQRFAFNTINRDGFTDNVADNVDFSDIDGRDQYSLRSSTAFQFSEQTEGLLFIQSFREDSNRMYRIGVRCTSDEVLGCNPDSAGFEYPNTDFTDGSLAALLGLSGLTRSNYYNTNRDGTLRSNPSDPRKVRTDVDPITEIEELIVSLELNHDFGEYVFTSLTAYHDKSFFGYQDFDNADGTDAFNVPVSYMVGPDQRLENTLNHSSIRRDESESEQYSQEFRLTSYLPGDLNYTLGAFWMKYESSSEASFYVPELSIFGDAIGVPRSAHGFNFQTPYFETNTWALFGEAYYSVSEDVQITAGLRYTEEDKDILTRQVSPLSYLNPTFDDSVFSSGDGAWEEFTGKLGVSYTPDLDFTDDTLLFATLSRGYKGGGINPGADASSFPTFDPEYINAIEAGTKNTLMNKKLQMNATTFFYKYDGYQVGGILPDGGTFNTNVDAEVYGAEFEMVALPTDGLLVNVNYALLETEVIEDFFTSPDISMPSGSGPVNIKGNELTFAPNSSIQLGIQYEHAVFDEYLVKYQLQAYWQDDFYSRLYNLDMDRLDSWNQVDGSITLSGADDVWAIELFAKNIADKASYTSLSVENSLVGRYRLPNVLEPRVVGLRFTYQYF